VVVAAPSRIPVPMRYTPLLLVLSAAVAGCGGGGAATGPADNGGTTPAVASVTVTPAGGTVPVGGTLQLNAAPSDADGRTIPGASPQWQSDAPTVASVGADGLVTGVSGGTANITATVSSGGATRTATALVTVSPVFTFVRLSHSDFTVAPGGIAQLTATPVDAAGNPVPGLPAPTWTSDAPSVATVSNGTVTAVAPGTANISGAVSHQGVTISASVRVSVSANNLPGAATVRGVDDGFSPASVTIAVGGTVTWVMEDEDHDITWTGSAPPGGNIAELEEGESATRSFPTAGTYTYVCLKHEDGETGTVVVEAGGGGGATPVLTSVTVAPSPASVAVGSTVQLTATGRDQYGSPMAGLPAATWQSSDATRASVSATGLVTGVAAGTATITATITSGGTTRTGSSSVTVGSGGSGPSTATVTTVDRTFSPRTVAIAAGGAVTWQFTATHNVTFGGATPTGGNIGNTSSGSVSRTFPTAGTYNYECTLHSNMTGTVTVQ
jgi:plastocyanin